MIIWQGKGGVQDRSIYEDSVFGWYPYSFCNSYISWIQQRCWWTPVWWKNEVHFVVLFVQLIPCI